MLCHVLPFARMNARTYAVLLCCRRANTRTGKSSWIKRVKKKFRCIFKPA